MVVPSMRVRPDLTRVAATAFLAGWILLSGCGGREGTDAREGTGVEATRSSDLKSACAEVPGCSESLEAPSVPREPILRVEVIREASGAVRVGRIESIEVEKGRGVPVGRSAGTHMLLALDGSGSQVDGVLIGFPETLRIERQDDWSGSTMIDLAGTELDTYGYLQSTPQIAEIAVADPYGTIVARAPAPRRSARRGVRGPGGLDALLTAAIVAPAVADETERWGMDLPPHCAHLILIDGERDRDRVRGISYENEVVLIRPEPYQQAAIQSALNMMTPMLCHGISRLALGIVPGERGVGGIVQIAAGDIMLINVAVGYQDTILARNPEKRVEMIKTILHEAAHATEVLLNAEGSRPEDFAGAWRSSQRSLASTTIERTRLEKSLLQEWMRIHESFVRHDWAHPYPSNDEEKLEVRDMSASQVARGGFMSRYGGTYYADDIADMVAWTGVAKYYRAAGVPEGPRRTEDYGCQEMRKHGSRDLPANFSALYTKMMLLRDLGMVHPEDVEQCTGEMGLPIDRRGLHFWEGDDYRRTFGDDLEAKIGTLGRRYVFELTGRGRAQFMEKEYPAEARLTLGLDPAATPLKEVSWPRGIYPLSLAGNNSFRLSVEEAPAASFKVYDGFALVAEATNERIAGSLFITKAMRLNAPIPVPQVFDPPLIIRFLIDK